MKMIMTHTNTLIYTYIYTNEDEEMLMEMEMIKKIMFTQEINYSRDKYYKYMVIFKYSHSFILFYHHQCPSGEVHTRLFTHVERKHQKCSLKRA